MDFATEELVSVASALFGFADSYENLVDWLLQGSRKGFGSLLFPETDLAGRIEQSLCELRHDRSLTTLSFREQLGIQLG